MEDIETFTCSRSNGDAAGGHKDDEKRQRIVHTLQSFAMFFITGMNDGNLGVILPGIRAYYGLSQSVVSILFLCTTAGYFIAAVANGYLIQKLSQAKAALIGAVSFTLGFLILLFAVPFPVMCCFVVFVGYGSASLQACANVVVAELPKASMMVNFLHACYGLGALIAPLTASAMLERHTPWNMTYMVLCSLAGANALSLAWAFRHLRTAAERQPEERDKKPNLLWAALNSRITYMGAVFLLFYVGAEVTLDNWGYTFLITARSSDTVAMARIMSGYWAGICAGRLFLAYFTLRFGEKRMTYCYLVLIIGMFLTLWLVPIVSVNATALVILGVALGPLYPSTVALASKTIPLRLYATSVGFLSAFGSGGSALFPYITGVMIGAKGIGSMLPFCVAMSGAMLVVWAFVPSKKIE